MCPYMCLYQAKEKDLGELVLMSHDAQHAKEVAKGELLKLEVLYVWIYGYMDICIYIYIYIY